MLALGDIGNHGEAQKSHNAACLEDTHIGKIQEYKRYKNTDIRKIRGQQVSPLSAFLPVGPCRGAGSFGSHVSDEHLWSLYVSGHSRPGWYR